MVRVAALKQKLAAGRPDLSIDGKTATEQLEAVHASVDQLMSQIYDCFQNQLLPELAHNGIVIADYATLDERERAAVDRYYAETIFPVLTPLAFDPGRPFPHISNLSLNLAIVLHDPRRTDDGPEAFRARESSGSAAATGGGSGSSRRRRKTPALAPAIGSSSSGSSR